MDPIFFYRNPQAPAVEAATVEAATVEAAAAGTAAPGNAVPGNAAGPCWENLGDLSLRGLGVVIQPNVSAKGWPTDAGSNASPVTRHWRTPLSCGGCVMPEPVSAARRA